MRKYLVSLMAAWVLGFHPADLRAARNINFESNQVKARQKEERKALDLKQKFQKESLKGQSFPKAERLRVKHEMQKESRELRERQKDERQELKDRQRVMKDSLKQT